MIGSADSYSVRRFWRSVALFGVALSAAGIVVAASDTDASTDRELPTIEQSDRNARDAVTLLEGYAAYKMADYDRALTIWRPLADADNPNAMLNISNLYEQGQGVPRDLTIAARWMLRAAERGYATAQLNYGLMLERGQGVARDLAAAGGWFEKAALQGDKEAAFNLGVLHATGFGGGTVNANGIADARGWLERAAAAGHIEARQMLASPLFARE